MKHVSLADVHDAIGILPSMPGYGVAFGPKSKVQLRAALTNCVAPGITRADMVVIASNLNCDVDIIKGIYKTEAPRGAYDATGMITQLYERHVFARNSDPVGEFNASHPGLSASKGYGAGKYGEYSAQFDKLCAAMALDPHAALCAVSWGAFQVLGENWRGCKYASPLDMVLSLVKSEAAHLDSFARVVRMKDDEGRRASEKLRQCRPGDPASCEPFVELWNGTSYRKFNYHVKLAQNSL